MTVDYLRGRIKELVTSGDAVVKMGGDNNASKMVLLPINKVY